MSLEQSNVFPIRLRNADQLALALDDSRAVAEELIELRHLEMAEDWLDIEERALEVERVRLDVMERALNVQRLQLEVDAQGARQKLEASKVAQELDPRLKEQRLKTEVVEVKYQRYRKHLALLGEVMGAVGTGVAASGAYLHVPSTGVVAGGIGVAAAGGALRAGVWVRGRLKAKAEQDPEPPASS